MADKRKSGMISAEERKYIIQHMNDMSQEEIAFELKKNIKVIEKEIRNYIDLPNVENNTIRWHLKQLADWKHLKQQFTPDELVLLEEKYIKYIDQVKDDVTATEESQVINMIRIEILMMRNMNGKMKLVASVHDLEVMRQSILDSVEGNFALLSQEDRQAIMDINNQISACRNVESARTSEFIELQKEFNAILSKLKVSRDQRVDKILNPKESFSQFVKSLLIRDKQEQESRIIQLYSKSVDKEEERLTKAHKYADGTYDNPILSVEILNKLDKSDGNNQEIQVSVEDFN